MPLLPFIIAFHHPSLSSMISRTSSALKVNLSGDSGAKEIVLLRGGVGACMRVGGGCGVWMVRIGIWS